MSVTTLARNVKTAKSMGDSIEIYRMVLLLA
jgi:hypothetical protein